MTTWRSLVIALAGLAVTGCGEGGNHGSSARIPSAAELAGTYDLTTKFDDQGSGATGIGVVSGDLFLELTVPFVGLNGLLGKSGAVDLEGMNLGSDAIEFVTGHAQVDERAGFFRVFGRLEGGAFTNQLTFSMRRPVDADLTAASGRYHVVFESASSQCACERSVDLDIGLTKGGTGSADGPVDIVRENGERDATLRSISVIVSPTARLKISAHYGDAAPPCGAQVLPGGPCTLSVTGTLPDKPGTSTSASAILQDGLTFQIGSDAVTITRLSGAAGS